MKKAFFTLAALFVCSTLCTAGERVKPNTLTAAEKKQGWQLLFDGETLNGWMSWRNKKPLQPNGWSVKDGTLHLSKSGGDIYTAKPYENFELSLEWKTTGNSGIMFRIDPKADGPMWRYAPEMQIERRNAAHLYALYPIQGKLKINPDGWNHVKIRMANGKGTHWFNGVRLYEYQIGSKIWNDRVLKSKFKKQIDKFAKTANGHIGFQDHGAAVSFRNVKIRELSGSKKD